MKKLKFAGFIKSNWFITLFSTMIGVVLGFYLTNKGEESKLLKKKENAIKYVANELNENKIILKEYGKVLDKSFDQVDYLFSIPKKNKEIIIHKDSLQSFKTRTQDIFTFEKSREVSDNNIQIHGKFNFQLNSRLVAVDLSNVIWNSYKQTEYLSETNFKCVTDLEALYNLTAQFNTLNKNWRRKLLTGRFFESRETTREFLIQWKELIYHKHLLLQMYDSSDTIIKSCD